ncbi:MAG: UbiH/UbiF/VisC/COQ6 family ubiquinone biosynthesis hydroxylase [Pseudomonadales bacterium]
MSEMFDIVIVGGGMAGCALACALADTHYKIAMIDNQTPQTFSVDNFFDPRVVALSMASREFLSALGVWDVIAAQRMSAFDRMQVWDGDGTAQINFAAADVQQSALGYIVENNLVVSALREQLQQQSNVQWLCPDAVVNLHDQNNADSARLLLQSGAELQGRLIVAADGAQSLLRQLSGINTMEWDYGHSAVVATVRTEKPHGAVARQRFMTTGPLAFLPLRDKSGDEHWCSVVWSMAPEAAQTLLAQSEQEFAAQLARAFESVLGDVLEVRGRFAFPLRQRHAQAYQRGRVVLIGDAAHTIHPLAGQGVNLGFMDVRVLAEELQRAQEKMLSPADASMLKRYQRRRRGANLTMTATMELFKQLFAQQALSVRWLRNTGMRGIDALPLLKKQIMRHAMGLSN